MYPKRGPSSVLGSFEKSIDYFHAWRSGILRRGEGSLPRFLPGDSGSSRTESDVGFFPTKGREGKEGGGKVSVATGKGNETEVSLLFPVDTRQWSFAYNPLFWPLVNPPRAVRSCFSPLKRFQTHTLALTTRGNDSPTRSSVYDRGPKSKGVNCFRWPWWTFRSFTAFQDFCRSLNKHSSYFLGRGTVNLNSEALKSSSFQAPKLRNLNPEILKFCRNSEALKLRLYYPQTITLMRNITNYTKKLLE